MKININIKLEEEDKIKKTSSEEETRDTGMFSIDRPLGAPSRLRVSFFDLWTKSDGNGGYEELPLSQNYDRGYVSETRVVDLDKGVYSLRKQHDNYYFWKNHYEFTDEAIIAEFEASEGVDFLDRKPLKPIIMGEEGTNPSQVKERDDYNRWDGVGVETPMFQVTLVRNEESESEEGTIYRWTNEDIQEGMPTNYIDSIPDKTSQTKMDANEEVYGYIINNIWIRKAHLRIQEFGSHSTCVNQGITPYEISGSYPSDGAQSVDMVEGIFWNNFNTYRNQARDNSSQLFKITRTANYDDDPVTDPILSFLPGKTTNCEVYLAPRRWLYYVQFDSPAYIEEIKEGLTDEIDVNGWTIGEGEDQSTTTETICYYNINRTEGTNYHNIFCIWDRPPHDFTLPRRKDNIIDHGEGREGGKIGASFLATPYLVPDWTLDEELNYVDWPMTYKRIREDALLAYGSDMSIYWTQLIANGLTYDDDYLGMEDGKEVHLYTVEEAIEYLEYGEFYYAWDDLSYIFDHVRDPIASLSGCKTTINSLYLYNFVGPLFNAPSTSEYFVYGKNWTALNMYQVAYGGYNESVEHYKAMNSLGSFDVADMLKFFAYNNLWQSPIWIQTASGEGTPIRITYPWINTYLGGYSIHSVTVDSEGTHDSYNIGADCYSSYRATPRSYYETYNWVYTPPHGGLLNFGYNADLGGIDDVPTIDAGRCLPDNDKQWFYQKESHAFTEGDIIIYKYPNWPISPRTLYNATSKYTEDECVNFDKIWNKIWNFQLIQDNVSTIDNGTHPADNVPYCACVGLTKAESLIAIVKVDSAVYYIWRTIDEGDPQIYTAADHNTPVARSFPNNRWTNIPAYGDGMMYSMPLYGCKAVFNPRTRVGHIQTLVERYKEIGESTSYCFPGEWDGGGNPENYPTIWRHFDSIACPTVDWPENVHETFYGYIRGLPDGSTVEVPWVYHYADDERPIDGREEVFHLEQPVLLMTYRERARFSSGYYASFFANSNCSNPSDDSYTAISSSLRNRDLYE